MALEIKQQLKLTQQLVMTPQLQQALKLLQMSRLELLQTIRQEILENPVLMEETEITEIPEEEIPDVEKEIPDSEMEMLLDFNWEAYLDSHSLSSSYPDNYEMSESAPNYENFVQARSSLYKDLLWQWRLNSPNDRIFEIGKYVIGNLNDNGYLNASYEELSRDLEELKPTRDEFESTLSLIQQLDPPGIAARDLSECLLLQLRTRTPRNLIAEEIVRNHLPLLKSRDVTALAKKLSISKDIVIEAFHVISELDPKPGRTLTQDPIYHVIPDAYVYKVDDDFLIVLNSEDIPTLRINPLYRTLLRKKKDLNKEAQEFIEKKMRSAIWLIKTVQQRHKTIYRVTESIVRFQRDFLDNGIQYLKPMVLKDVADDIGMHESTVSRVTQGKYIATPQGLFEFKFFFTSSLESTQGGSVSAESVKHMIRQIILNEDPKNPLSDEQVANLLKRYHIKIARRTVAKYREAMRILPSKDRKKNF
ncbi:MAG: RNA polymerase sigma-54 factor [Deltaproteobacteria bacterium]|nr:MAG: RNA polymerase sigma-54 factor [Deltaproteobacteria bacterium]